AAKARRARLLEATLVDAEKDPRSRRRPKLTSRTSSPAKSQCSLIVTQSAPNTSDVAVQQFLVLPCNAGGTKRVGHFQTRPGSRQHPADPRIGGGLRAYTADHPAANLPHPINQVRLSSYSLIDHRFRHFGHGAGSCEAAPTSSMFRPRRRQKGGLLLLALRRRGAFFARPPRLSHSPSPAK